MQLLGEVNFSSAAGGRSPQHIVRGARGEKVERFQSDKSDRNRECVYMRVGQSVFNHVEVFRLTRSRLQCLTTGQTARTMIVVAVRCGIVALYSQENRCCCCCWPLLSRGKSAVTWNLPQNYSLFQCPDFSVGPIVSGTICGVLEKESLATKYENYFERIVWMTVNHRFLIWSQSVTYKRTWDVVLTASWGHTPTHCPTRATWGPALPCDTSTDRQH